MNKYIKLNAAIRILWELSMPRCDYESGAKQLESLPTIDIVHCRDCKNYAGEGMRCAENIMVMFDHFYCYYGERIEE